MSVWGAPHQRRWPRMPDRRLELPGCLFQITPSIGGLTPFPGRIADVCFPPPPPAQIRAVPGCPGEQLGASWPVGLVCVWLTFEEPAAFALPGGIDLSLVSSPSPSRLTCSRHMLVPHLSRNPGFRLCKEEGPTLPEPLTDVCGKRPPHLPNRQLPFSVSRALGNGSIWKMCRMPCSFHLLGRPAISSESEKSGSQSFLRWEARGGM